MLNAQTLIRNLRNQTIDTINDETALTEIIKTTVNGNATIECSAQYTCLENKKCDLKLTGSDNASNMWIEIKDNITLLPFGNSKIIYEQDKLIFLDIARLLGG